MQQYIKRQPTPFERPAALSPVLHRLLENRGIDSAEAAERYLHPDARCLHDPWLLNDMRPAVALLRAAMANGEPICVYGDYDVDGVSASAIMQLYLASQGADARVYLPLREEGYGLNEAAIRQIALWAKLLVTVDCGVTSVELVALAKSLGLQVIVTDHHRPADALPDCPVINPLLNDYPFPWLCGAGVAWKLVWALSGEIPMDLMDLAALATVADIVSLTDENRAIVAMGLKAINAAPRPGLRALIAASGLEGKPIRAGHISFQLAPRLNAGGRLDTAMRPFRLVTTEDPAEAAQLAAELNARNTQRQAIEQQMLEAAEARLEGFDFIRHRAIILSGRDWPDGVIGLTAGKLKEKYNFPTVILSDRGDVMKGSCRSIEGVDIHAALSACANTLLGFGGHRMAAGLTLESARLSDFIEAMDAWLWANVPPETYVPRLPYDDALNLDDVTPGLIAELGMLEPTGMGNPAPVFRAGVQVVDAWCMGKGGKDLSLNVSQGGHRLKAVAFGEGHRLDAVRVGPLDALFVPTLNEWQGRTSVQLMLRAMAFPDLAARIRSKLDEELSLQCDFLTEIIYNKKIDPLPAIDPDALADSLRASPQGTLIVTADLATAARIADLGPCELHIGALPEDPRCFNAVCCCPKPGALHPSWRRVVLAGCPGEWLRGDVPACRLAVPVGWTECLPDVEQLRDGYRALRRLELASEDRPAGFSDLRTLALRLTEVRREARPDAPAYIENPLTARMALLALRDMGQFEYDFGAVPPRVRRLEGQTRDPDDVPVWRTIQRWRDGAI